MGRFWPVVPGQGVPVILYTAEIAPVTTWETLDFGTDVAELGHEEKVTSNMSRLREELGREREVQGWQMGCSRNRNNDSKAENLLKGRVPVPTDTLQT